MALGNDVMVHSFEAQSHRSLNPAAISDMKRKAIRFSQSTYAVVFPFSILLVWMQRESLVSIKLHSISKYLSEVIISYPVWLLLCLYETTLRLSTHIHSRHGICDIYPTVGAPRSIPIHSRPWCYSFLISSSMSSDPATRTRERQSTIIPNLYG